MIWAAAIWQFGAKTFGINAPRFIWIAAAAIVLATLEEIGRLCFRVAQEKALCKELSDALAKLREDHPSRRDGLGEEGYEALRKVFEVQPNLRPAWRNYDAELISQNGTDGHDHFFCEGSAAGAFSDAALFGGRINWRWFAAFPGFITGLGLLFTFIAILFALADLKSDSSGQITGIQKLLEGLSGKFLSSVAALISASIFLLIERFLIHRLEGARQGLITTLDDFVPRLTPARLLVEIRRESGEQTEALRTLLTDLGPKLKQGLSESVGPTLDRMVGAIEELSQITRAAEAQRQYSLTEALKGTLDELKRDLKNTLARWARASANRWSVRPGAASSGCWPRWSLRAISSSG